ncbi:APC family permease [Rhodococcus sp. LB1]|uniref:APC family permease n=1 Tax=Rhodococcus sp. LB1 TaxID=1807499 RepID=UPI00077AD832|nr:APC family permease [Rhodococcus sp. LB1]KXX57114.1 amino acid ABC transporter permease [Rhodococcus sp. LB1]
MKTVHDGSTTNDTMMSSAGIPDAEAGQLPRGILPTWAVFGVSLGILAPASTLALAIGVVVTIAGNLSWITWAVTSVLVLGFAGGIGWLAKRFTTTGGTYGLAARAAGKPAGFFVMVTHLASSLVAGPACVIGSAIYLDAFLQKVGLPASTWTLGICAGAVAVAVTALNLREVKLSAKLLLVIEFFTVAVIVVLLIVVLANSDTGPIDSRQFDFHGFSATAILATAGFSVFSLAGFDHAATLGREARHPKRAISFAVVGSVLACGVLYIVATYIIVLGFRGLPIENMNAPLDTLAEHNGVGWLGYLIDIGVAISFFGSTLGVMAGTSRTVYTLARDGLLPARLGKVSARHGTPVGAVTTLGVIYLVAGLLGVVVTAAETSYGLLGTYAGYMLIAAYGLTALAAGYCAIRSRSLRLGIGLATVLAAIGSVLVYWYSFNPFPSGARGVVAWIFFATVLGYIALYCYLRLRKPLVFARIGESDRKTTLEVDADEQAGAAR